MERNSDWRFLHLEYEVIVESEEIIGGLKINV